VVEFVPREAADRALQVSAGRGADLRHRTIFELTEPKTETLRRALDAADPQKNATEKEPTRGETLGAKVPEALSKLSESADGGELSGPTGPVEPAEEGLRSGTDSASKRSAPSIDILIQDAQSCLIVRDWKCAASRYQDILKHYPGRPESTAVLISLAKIELRRLNTPSKALDHYKSYQQRAPKGPMAEEALYGIADAYRRLGKTDMEKETLRLFVERHPQSSQLERVRARLHQLEGDMPM
jgi:TolA-binding protein